MAQLFPKIIREDLSLVFSGQAGSGIKTIEALLSKILKKSGYYVFATKEYMSRIRGGFNTTKIRIASSPVASFSEKIDILIPIDDNNLGYLKNKITENTVILGENIEETDKLNLIEIPFKETLKELGLKTVWNIIAIGIIAGLLKLEKNKLDDYIREYFSKYSEEIIEADVKAVNTGYDTGKKLSEEKIKIHIERHPEVKEHILLDGTDAISLGAIAGGCNFITAYPMTPGSGVLNFLAKYHKKFGIAVEQSEDEISAINMCTGAWYGGARAMVTTSGGGFALMCEGISLSGMTEIPVVVHLGQRPGPATGLPTRTEQGDLELALYAGHGEFPRIIFAPNNLKNAFYLAHKAFNLADKFQVPVIILTDQFLIDSYSNIDIKSLNISDTKVEKYFIKTEKDYRRYAMTEDGITERGIPGYGNGLIIADSDEHDEEGHITEDFDVRTNMVNKRLKKMDRILEDVIEPEFMGKENYKTLIIGWGSTCETIKEALEKISTDTIAFLSFSQVYPLYSGTKKYLEKAEKLIIIENNATGQFGKLIKLYTGVEIENKILKYNGLPFSVEEIMEKIKNYF